MSDPKPILSRTKFSALPEPCWKQINLLRRLIVQCEGVPHGQRRKCYDRVALSAGVSANGQPLMSGETLRKKHAAWKREGEVALIDHTLCGGRCGQLTCNNIARQSLLHGDTVNHWLTQAHSNQHQERKNATTCFRKAHRDFLRSLEAGEVIPGLANGGRPGTWRDLWVRMHARRAVPPRCPWGLGKSPKGHSYQNFMDRRCASHLTDVAIQGIKAMKLAVPQTRMDVSNLRPLEVIQVDDVELNVTVEVTNDAGAPELCKVNVLLWMDVATRRILHRQLIPATRRDDGTRRGITLQDVQHGLVVLLARCGVPVDYDMVIRCENATAAIPHELEEDLKRISPNIDVSRTDVYRGVILPDGFAQRVGASWQKPHLESFNRRLAIELGTVPGQTGGNYTLKPGEQEGRMVANVLVLKRLGEVFTPEDRTEFMHLYNLEQVTVALDRAIHALQTNPEHELQGFAEARQWRFGAEDHGGWKPLNHPAMQKMRERHGDDYANDFISEPENHRVVRETVMERWDRLYKIQNIQQLSIGVLFFLWMDKAEGRWTAHNEITATLKRGRSYVFGGSEHSAEQGQPIWVKFDASEPDLGCVLVNAQGAPLGRMAARNLVAWGDHAARMEAYKEKLAAEIDLQRQLGEIHLGPRTLAAKTAAVDDRLAKLASRKADLDAQPVVTVFTQPTATDKARTAALPQARSSADTMRKLRERRQKPDVDEGL